MKITDIEIVKLNGPPLSQPVRPAWTPGGSRRSQDATLFKVSTDEGITGWGATYAGELPGAVESFMKPKLIGADPFALEQHARIFRNVGAAWGLEIALWDIIGKACGQPLYKLWGGARDRVPGYASCMEMRSGEQRAEDAAARRAEGWRAIKLRLHANTIKEDIAQVEGVRRAMGNDFTILVDANQAQIPGTPMPEEGPVWTYERALQTARELQQLGVFWLEEPLNRYDFEGLARLCENVDMYISGGENNRGLHEFRWLIERNVYDVIQPESMVSETMSGLRKICSMAEMHRKLVAPHHGGGGVGLAAHLHLACAVPNSTYFEMLCEPPIMTTDDFQWYLKEPLRVNADGDIVVPSGPGLGVEPDPDLVARYRVG
ncbi:MAG: mandelate racemase/muconate lactonizing enzyme family protein [Chloroflexota bacterium]